MGLLDEVEQAQSAQRRGNCGIRRVLDTLDPGDADELRAILAEPVAVYGHVVIARVLNARGIEIGRRTVEAHRSGACSCR